MMKKAFFYFILKTLFVFEIFHFLFLIFVRERKQFHEKAKVNFKTYDFTNWGNKQLQ